MSVENEFVEGLDWKCLENVSLVQNKELEILHELELRRQMRVLAPSVVKTVHKAERLVGQLGKTSIEIGLFFLQMRADEEATLKTFEENLTEQGPTQEVAGGVCEVINDLMEAICQQIRKLFRVAFDKDQESLVIKDGA